MSFLSTIGLIETPEQERERLAQAEPGSLTHYLSTLPETITGWKQDLIIELVHKPWRDSGDTARIVVVPITYSPSSGARHVSPDKPRQRNDGYWECAVVASTDPRYPVGGHRLSISNTELSRGRLVQIDLGAPLSNTGAGNTGSGNTGAAEWLDRRLGA